MKLFTKLSVLVSGALLSITAFAADPLANTTWQTFDEGVPKAVIKITESEGVLTGKIVSTTRPEGKKFVGKTIISGLKSSGQGKYTGGSITDPEKNKTYKLTFRFKNGRCRGIEPLSIIRLLTRVATLNTLAILSSIIFF